VLHLWDFVFIVGDVHLPSLDDNWQSLVDFLREQRIHNVIGQTDLPWCAEAMVLHVGHASAADDNVPLQMHVD
jgi:hypothetical protein